MEVANPRGHILVKKPTIYRSPGYLSSEIFFGSQDPISYKQNDETPRNEKQLSVVRLTTTPNLLGIDIDSRAQILEYLLLNRSRKVKPGVEEGRKYGEADVNGPVPGLSFRLRLQASWKAVAKEGRKYGEADINGPVHDFRFHIRQLIFEKPDGTPTGDPHAFQHTRDATLTTPRAKVLWEQSNSTSIPHVQILRVCRQLFHEGVAILYGKNRFNSHYWFYNRAIPYLFGKSNMDRIKTFTMAMPQDLSNIPNGKMDSFVESVKEVSGLCE